MKVKAVCTLQEVSAPLPPSAEPKRLLWSIPASFSSRSHPPPPSAAPTSSSTGTTTAPVPNETNADAERIATAREEASEGERWKMPTRVVLDQGVYLRAACGTAWESRGSAEGLKEKRTTPPAASSSSSCSAVVELFQQAGEAAEKEANPESDDSLPLVRFPVSCILQLLRSRKPGSSDLKIDAGPLWLDPRAASLAPNQHQECVPINNNNEEPPPQHWVRLTCLLTFSTVALRENFLEQVVEVAQAEQHATEATPMMMGEANGRAVKSEGEAESVTKEEEVVVEVHSSSRTNSTARSLNVELSDFFCNTVQTPQSQRSQDPVRVMGSLTTPSLSQVARQQQQHRGVYQAASNVLETILLDPQTWQLRHLTEQMESDILRQIPRLALLFQRFVSPTEQQESRHSDNVEPPATTPHTSPSLAVKPEEGTQESDPHLREKKPFQCSREAFWTAVARQYFCFAHTFLEDEGEEVQEATTTNKSVAQVQEEAALNPVKGNVSLGALSSLPAAARDVEGPTTFSSTAFLPASPNTTESALNAASWTALPKPTAAGLLAVPSTSSSLRDAGPPPTSFSFLTALAKAEAEGEAEAVGLESQLARRVDQEEEAEALAQREEEDHTSDVVGEASSTSYMNSDGGASSPVSFGVSLLSLFRAKRKRPRLVVVEEN